MIDSYSFGEIVINGKTYTSDLILYPDKVDDNWWRKSSHLLQKEDLTDIIQYNLEVFIVGTGAYGLMKIPDDTRKFLESKGIKLLFEGTGEACKIYNEMKEKRKVVAAFHLTC